MSDSALGQALYGRSGTVILTSTSASQNFHHMVRVMAGLAYMFLFVWLFAGVITYLVWAVQTSQHSSDKLETMESLDATRGAKRFFDATMLPVVIAASIGILASFLARK
jgi:flagellar biosynthesis protein FlhB